jgi:twinkle protein
MTPAELSEKLWDNAERVAKYLLPRGHLEGKEWCAGNTNGDAGKSLKINLGGKKTWADFASGDSGDLLDLWVLVRNCQLHDAMREAKEFLGLKDDDNHFEAKKKPSHGQPKKALKRRAIATTTSSRGITRETADQFRVSDAVVWYHDENREIPAVAFPYLRNGELLQVKRIGTERPNGKKLIMAEADCEPCLFGWQAMDAKARAVVLCEGEIDCMTYSQFGISALSVPFGGGKGAKQQWIEYEYHNLDRFEEIWLSLDNDDVGREAAKEIARRLGSIVAAW